MQKPRLKGLFSVSDTHGGSDYTMGRVVRLESSGKILRVNQEKVILDRNHFNFLVQVIDRGYVNAAGGYAEGGVLDSFEFLNKGWSDVVDLQTRDDRSNQIVDWYSFCDSAQFFFISRGASVRAK